MQHKKSQGLPVIRIAILSLLAGRDRTTESLDKERMLGVKQLTLHVPLYATTVNPTCRALRLLTPWAQCLPLCSLLDKAAFPSRGSNHRFLRTRCRPTPLVTRQTAVTPALRDPWMRAKAVPLVSAWARQANLSLARFKGMTPFPAAEAFYDLWARVCC